MPAWRAVRARNVYLGVDLVVHAGRELEYDLVVAPGADPRAVRLAFDGADEVALDAQGDATVRAGGGAIVHGGFAPQAVAEASC